MLYWTEKGQGAHLVALRRLLGVPGHDLARLTPAEAIPRRRPSRAVESYRQERSRRAPADADSPGYMRCASTDRPGNRRSAARR